MVLKRAWTGKCKSGACESLSLGRDLAKPRPVLGFVLERPGRAGTSTAPETALGGRREHMRPQMSPFRPNVTF
jgi:hypothetical protein